MIAPDQQCSLSSSEAAAAIYHGAGSSFNPVEVLCPGDLYIFNVQPLCYNTGIDASHACEIRSMKGVAGRNTEGCSASAHRTCAVFCGNEEIPRRSHSSLPPRTLASDYLYSSWPRAQSLTRLQQYRRSPYHARGGHDTTRCQGGQTNDTDDTTLHHASHREQSSERGRKRTRQARYSSWTSEDGIQPVYTRKSLSRARRHDRTAEASRSRSISCAVWNPGPFVPPYPPVSKHDVSLDCGASYRHSSCKTSIIDIYTASVKDLLDGYANGTFTCVSIVQEYYAQIARFNGLLRAVVYVAPRRSILRQARKCDEERKSGEVNLLAKPLHGIPIIVKDNIATDVDLGMPTTAGSFALLGMPVKADAFVVSKLRAAGAIIIGKANMSELASFKGANSGDGWSAVGGQTINVYAPHASPGSSSSGNGVALAAGFCPLSIGTETDGSITQPCLQSSLYGLKPTVGLLSRSGVVPFAPYFDTPGPMAKDVPSLAIALDVMAGPDPEDKISVIAHPTSRKKSYFSYCVGASFDGIRIGIPRKGWLDTGLWPGVDCDPLPAQILDSFELAMAKLATLGAHVQDPAEIPSAMDGSLSRCVTGSRSAIVAADCNYYLTKYLQGLGGRGGCRSVADIIRFNEDNADLEMPPGHYGQEYLERCLSALSVDSPEYVAAIDEMRQVAGTNGLDAVLDANDLDAIVCVRKGGHSLANMIGAPIGTVPLGLLDDGTPFGVYFIARRHGEGKLVRIMAAWEQVFPRPLPPIAYM